VITQESRSSGVRLRKEPPKYPWIDALRGAAILGVIAVHASDHVAGWRGPTEFLCAFGQMGVQLFFIASAITLCLSTASRAERHPVLSFYIRRYFRIAPLYYAGIILYALVSIPNNYLHGHGLHAGAAYNLPNVTANFLFIHGFYAPGNNNVIPGGWSIATEMGFYVIFPFLFVLYAGLGRWREALTGVIIALCGAVELVIGSYTGQWPWNNKFEYYSLLNQLPVFLIGILAYYRLKSAPVKILPVAITGTLALLAAAGLWNWSAPMAFYFIPMLCAIGFSALALIFSQISIHYPHLLIAVGKNSYSIYILHFAALLLVDWGMNHLHAYPPPIAGFLLRFIVTLGFAFLGSQITERLIERRGIDLGRRILSAMPA